MNYEIINNNGIGTCLTFEGWMEQEGYVYNKEYDSYSKGDSHGMSRQYVWEQYLKTFPDKA